MAFSTAGVQPVSAYRIAPTNNRLQRNMYGNGYSEFMDYSAIDAFPNLGYGAATRMPAVGGIETLMLISWCREQPKCCKINSV
jgi:hypothetical protein